MARLCGQARNLAQETVRKRTGVASIENLRIETFTQVRSRRGQNLQQVPGTSWAADAAPGCPERGCIWTKLGRRVSRLLGVVGSRKKRKRDPARARRLTATLRKAEQLRKPSKVSKLRMPRIALQAIDPESIGASECFKGTQSPKV